jgi:beta-glucosidase
LPLTFPADLSQTPRPELSGMGTPWGTAVTVEYQEGAEVGYRWFAKTGQRPLYAFGHGLAYTTFTYGDLEVEGGETVVATFTVTNTGDRAGADVPQLYLVDAPGDKRMRLLGFERVELEPGASREVTLTADRRLLARFDRDAGHWRIDEGAYKVALGSAADAIDQTAQTTLTGALFGS